MALVPTLLNIYARNQRWKHNRRAFEQEQSQRKAEQQKRDREAEIMRNYKANNAALQEQMQAIPPITFNPLTATDKIFGRQ
jgi:hypothetical protein